MNTHTIQHKNNINDWANFTSYAKAYQHWLLLPNQDEYYIIDIETGAICTNEIDLKTDLFNALKPTS